MTVKVTVQITVQGERFTTQYATEDDMFGSDVGFIADSTRLAVHRALKRVLQQMPPSYKERRDGIYDRERANYCQP
jgi:hypothetical protein